MEVERVSTVSTHPSLGGGVFVVSIHVYPGLRRKRFTTTFGLLTFSQGPSTFLLTQREFQR